MNFSKVGTNSGIFKGNELLEFKAKQIKDFMNVNYGIRSRKEHFGMESVATEDDTDNNIILEDDTQEVNDETYLCGNQDDETNTEVNTSSFITPSVRMKY